MEYIYIYIYNMKNNIINIKHKPNPFKYNKQICASLYSTVSRFG